MKQTFIALASLLTLAVCSSCEQTPSSEESGVIAEEVTFETASNYFFKNDQPLPASPKITSEEEFSKLFGAATTMGENGKPTPIDFSKQFVVAIVLPVTDIATEITPVKVEAVDSTLRYSFDIKEGEQQSFTIQPVSIIILDKKYEDYDVLLLNDKLMKASMKEVQAYLKECGAFFIATADGDQPHVRPFGVSEIIDGRLYIMTGKVKDVFKQMASNGKFEICALKPSGSEWMRLSGTLVNDETLAVKEEFLNRNEGLKSMYRADDDNMAVLYITDATARFCSFTAPERRGNF